MIAPPDEQLLALVSRRDEISPSRKVARGDTHRELRHAIAEPAYRYGGEAATIDDYLSRHRTTGLLVLKDDTILVERYQYERTAAHRMTSMSMAKTVVAMLVGIAVHEKAVASIDDRAQDYVRELRGTPYGETPLRDLLRMASGMRFSEVYSGSDDVALLARLSIQGESEGGPATVAPFTTRARPAGEAFHYASADTQVLGLVVRAATGMTLADYLSERIWKAMGAEADASWLIDRGGYEAGFSGLNATLRDYARFGMLLANGGALDGRQIIPASWVRAATTPDRFATYGYQTWILGGRRPRFAMRGIRGQAVLVDPARKVVLVHTAAAPLGVAHGELLALWNSAAEQLAR